MRATPALFLLMAFATAMSADIAGDSSYLLTLAPTQVHAQAGLLDQVGQEPLILTAADWEGQGLSLADVLATHAGIQTRRMGGMGSFQSVSIRGVAANKVLICVDGVPLGESHGSAVNLGAFDLNQLERIEVYKGQVPAAFGSNGLGGVVNLVTRKKVG
ncbi:MAG TPA: TonB-dependent receptor plug domain-containing protein, partial [Fibrobacteraceae bacterium]|nr:TonB-dependent receptor plug domain-containing protein [Fibrobacteraceae bacterium]